MTAPFPAPTATLDDVDRPPVTGAAAEHAPSVVVPSATRDQASSAVVVPAPSTDTAPAGAWVRRRGLGVAAILVSATAMGTAGVFGRMASPPGAVIGEALTMGRMLVGALGMAMILLLSRRIGALRRTRLSLSVALGGVFLGLSLALLLSATVLTNIALAVALLYIGPVLATVLARVLLKELPTPIETLSLGAAFVGMMLAAGLLDGGGSGSAQHGLGIALGVGAGVSYAAALLCYRFRSDMPADVRSFWNFTFGTLATAAMVAITRPDLSGMTATNWAWALAFFVVCGLLALGLLVLAGKHLRTAELSGLSYWEVVVALGLGAALFGEAISPLAGLGALIIIAAAAVPLLLTRRRTTPTQ